MRILDAGVFAMNFSTFLFFHRARGQHLFLTYENLSRSDLIRFILLSLFLSLLLLLLCFYFRSFILSLFPARLTIILMKI